MKVTLSCERALVLLVIHHGPLREGVNVVLFSFFIFIFHI